MASLSTTPAFVINTTYRIHPDDAEAFKALMVRLAKAATEFEGSAFYNVGQNVVDPTIFHLIEGWESGEAFAAVLTRTDFQELLGEALKLRIIERFGDKILVSGMEKLEMPS